MSATEFRHNGGMDSATITQSLGTILNPIVLAGTTIVILDGRRHRVAGQAQRLQHRGRRPEVGPGAGPTPTVRIVPTASGRSWGGPGQSLGPKRGSQLRPQVRRYHPPPSGYHYSPRQPDSTSSSPTASSPGSAGSQTSSSPRSPRFSVNDVGTRFRPRSSPNRGHHREFSLPGAKTSR